MIVERPMIRSKGEESKMIALMSKSVIVSVNFFHERVNKIDNFEIKAIILDSSPLDLIIGRSTIKIIYFIYTLIKEINTYYY